MKVVAISGYFDPIHVGHLEYINMAKKLGDKLVVIVNNNYQCELKKGKPSEKKSVEIHDLKKDEKYDKAKAAKMSSKQKNDLPDSDFAYIEPGGKKDDDGKTVPRSLRHLPINDAAHVRNALARLDQTDISPEAKKTALKKIKAAAKKFGIKVSEASGAIDYSDLY